MSILNITVNVIFILMLRGARMAKWSNASYCADSWLVRIPDSPEYDSWCNSLLVVYYNKGTVFSDQLTSLYVM